MSIPNEYSYEPGNVPILNIINSVIVVAIFFGFPTHLMLRELRGAHQIYELRDILMMASAGLIFLALHASPSPNPGIRTLTPPAITVPARIASAVLAVSLAVAGAASLSSGIVLPLLPSVNLGWPFLLAAGATLAAALRRPGSTTTMPLLGIAALVLGFVAAEGAQQGLITAGTVAWNVVTDFDFAILVPIVLLVSSVESIVSRDMREDEDGRGGAAEIIRASLATATVFVLAMGISLQSAGIACAGVMLVVASVWTLWPLVAAKRSTPRSRWSASGRRAVAWCATAGAIAIVWRGIAHIGEAAALSTSALVVIGLVLRWARARDVVAMTADATRSMLALGLAFIAAALWNLLVNYHGDLATALRWLGVPGEAIFPAGVLLLAVLAYRFDPVWLVVVMAPLLYLGLESFAPAPVWAVPVIALAVAMAMGFRLRFRANRVLGVGAAGLLVVGLLSAFASRQLVGREAVPRSARPSLAANGPGALALADGGIRRLDDIAANRWVRLETFGPAPLRPYHGGSAFDSKRGRILLFGADTHFRDWNNAVTAFDLSSQTWVRHYRPSPRYAMRADEAGNRISGITALGPWPMHTYDGVVYHSGLDALVVAAAPLHSLKAVPNGRFDPTWIYDLKSLDWRIGPVTGQTTPRFFAGTAVYDARRDSVFYYNTVPARLTNVRIGRESQYFVPELYELTPDQGDWRKVSHAPPLRSHRLNAALDTRRDGIALFAGNARDSTIRIFGFDDRRRTSGTWRTRALRGAACGRGSPYAVAYDDSRDLFLVLPQRRRGRANLSCIYDPERRTMTRLRSADLPYLNMNYNLHYVAASGMFVLVTGGSLHGHRAEVRVIRLDRSNP